ncbi:MAG: ABC transporter permease, partial [Niameybacter sp.]
YICLVGVILMAWSVGLSNAQKLLRLEETVELRYTADRLTLDQVKEVEKGETESENKLIKGVVAWKQTSKQTFKNEELEKSIEGDLLEVYGQLTLLLPQDKLIGQNLYKGDSEGAIITKGVAEQLWGSTDVVGKTFKHEEREYVVRGILQDATKSIVVQVNEKSKDAQFSALRLVMMEQGNIEEHLNTLRSKYSLPEGIVNNLSLKSIGLSNLVLLPGGLLGTYVLLKLYYFIYKTHRYWVSALLLALIAICTTWMMSELVPFTFQLPAYMIPNQWSDIEFWSNLVNKIGENKAMLDALPSYLPDYWYQTLQTNLIISFTLTMVGIMLFIKKMKLNTGKELFVRVLLAIVISFVSILVMYGIGEEVGVIRAFWVVIPMYLVIDFLITKWKTLFEIQ